MKIIYQKLKGINGTGLLLTKHQTDKGTLIRGASLVLNRKQIVSIIHANDKGWHGKDGKVENFRIDKNRLFIRHVVVQLNAWQ